jgi:hypothetical protein
MRISQPRACKRESFIGIISYPDPGFKSAMARRDTQSRLCEGSEKVCPFQRIRSGMPHILRQSLEYLRSEVGFAWSANVILQTRQSLASQVTSQIVRPEINVTFRYNPKKVRGAWGISQIIIDLILGWFLAGGVTTRLKQRGSKD